METTVTRFTVSPNVCSATSDDGTTILDIEQGKLYSATGVGSVIWSKLMAAPAGMPMNAIITELQKDFDNVPLQQIERDAECFVTQLKKKGVIQASDRKSESHVNNRGSRIVKSSVSLISLAVNFLLKLKLNVPAAYLLLIASDLMLKLGSFRSLHYAIKSWPLASEFNSLSKIAPATCTAIENACTYYPKQAVCLQRSVVATCMLRYYGVPAQLVIGVRKMPFYSHAWVEVEGVVVNDHEQVQTYFSVLSRS